MTPLYERLGGEPAMQAAVDLFYRKVLRDPHISGFFDDVDMDGQMAKQKAFITMATGGPAAYSGRDMTAGHAHLVKRGLDDSHVDAVAGHLQSTLEELGVDAEDVAEVMALVGGLRDAVLGRGTTLAS